MGCLALIIGVPILLFPSDLPNSRNYRVDQRKERRPSQRNDAHQSDLRRRLSELPQALKHLLTNKTFMSLNFAAAADGLFLSAF